MHLHSATFWHLVSDKKSIQRVHLCIAQVSQFRSLFTRTNQTNQSANATAWALWRWLNAVGLVRASFSSFLPSGRLLPAVTSYQVHLGPSQSLLVFPLHKIPRRMCRGRDWKRRIQGCNLRLGGSSSFRGEQGLKRSARGEPFLSQYVYLICETYYTKYYIFY